MTTTGGSWVKESYCFEKQAENAIQEIKIYDKEKEFHLVFIFKEKGKSQKEFYLATKRDTSKPRAFKNLHRLNNYLREHFKGVPKTLIY